MRLCVFDWDDGNWPKCGKHGLSQQDIEQVFRNSPAVYADPGHSWEEQRLRAIGQNDKGRYIFVAFTMRAKGHQTYFRPISARYMHLKEIENYEQ